jgi:hypothetical protein
MSKLPQVHSTVNVSDVLMAAGYRIRGRRADCPRCKGHSRLTVSFTEDGRYYCHRCHFGGHIRQLAHVQGITLPPTRVKAANIPKMQFRAWLSEKMTVLGEEERKGHKKLEWANTALFFSDDFGPAWDFLSWFYARRCTWQAFWTSATDNVGRYWLYRAWRRHGA